MEEKIDWSSHVRTVMTTDQEIIKAVIKLHNNGLNFDLDPTYSKGVFWRGLTPPNLKFDLNPVIEGVTQADCTALPIESESLQAIMFDPPFVLRESGKSHSGIIANRFSSFRSIEDLWCFYLKALEEFSRILKPGGIVAFKCQDTISGGKEYWSHFEIMKMAEKLDFHIKDILILYRGDNVLFSPNMKNQKHARKTHCYYIILEKKDVSLARKNLSQARTRLHATDGHDK